MLGSKFGCHLKKDYEKLLLEYLTSQLLKYNEDTFLPEYVQEYAEASGWGDYRQSHMLCAIRNYGIILPDGWVWVSPAHRQKVRENYV